MISLLDLLPYKDPNIPDYIDVTGLLCKKADLKDFVLDEQLLKADAESAQSAHPFTRKKGHWSSIPLRSANGDIGEPGSRSFGIHNSPDISIYKDTVVMNATKYIRKVLDDLGCKYYKVRIMRVLGKGVIPEHIDNFQAEDIVRLHIPIVTNPLVEFIIDGTSYYLKPNRLYYVNVRKKHKVINSSRIDRIHIVIDIKWDSRFAKRFYKAISDILDMQ